MIVVTGATGALGGATVENLLTRIPASQLGVSVRDVNKARHFADRGVLVRQGSYEDPAALRASFAGAEQVLLVSGNDPAADVVALHRNAIDAAVAAGVKRILYTSQQGAADGPYPPGRLHAATEAILADSGIAWTALRCGFFGSLDQLLGPWQRTGVIAAPADGPIPWIERADIAEAVAVILAGDDAFDGPITLTTPHPVTLDDLAGFASQLTGRDITRVVVDDEQWVTEQTANGLPDHLARMTLAMFQAVRTGYFAEADPLLTELLGREPRHAVDQLADAIT
ncbi:uncharacterized protein YbjT (DUF2867 family) [Tamaricihabitans halophyticus]|uniref:Uncharacterized protein YbjT (DUF2867 family) n=1 Tax=Tamaricihabitans halophyticus TaxID=1262583 RepID=A0A4R2Q0F9_9PSEU|nr:uncharacterized protein YbjT (DUF2867 family) [Tamaricihabitans halophyticus]